MFSEPTVIEGFYATRTIARRVGRFVMLAGLIVGAILLGSTVIIATAFDILAVSWGIV